MKTLTTLAIILTATLSSYAQTLNVNNTTACPIFMYLAETDAFCNTNVTLVAVPPGVTPFTSTPGFRWEYVRGVADVFPYTSCTTPLVAGAPWAWCTVGLPATSSGPQCTCIAFLNVNYGGTPAFPVVTVW